MSRSRPWMPLFVAEYLADTQHLDAEQHGAYLLLIMHQWQHGSVPNDQELLPRIARIYEPNKWANVWRVLRRFFVQAQEGGQQVLRQKRCTAELAKAVDLSDKRRGAALQKHSKRRAHADANGPANADAIAPANAPANDHAHADQLDTHARTRARATLHTQEHLHRHRQEQEGAYAPSSRARASPAEPAKISEPALAKAGDWPLDYREQFADAYPHKVGMAAALKSLDTAWGTVSWAIVLDALATYVATKPPDRQWANPKTWIEEERWNDRPAPVAAGNGRTHVTDADIAAELAREAGERKRGTQAAEGEAGRGGSVSAGGGDVEGEGAPGRRTP